MKVEIHNVSLSYGLVRAVNSVNLEVAPGELFGLIGPDGAGKTTLFRIITTLLKPDQGSVLAGGYDSVRDYKSVRQFTGYMPGRFSLYPDLSVKENLDFYATIFKTTVRENYEIIKPVYFFLEPFGNRLARNLSGGMKQKLALCCALIHNPKLLVLDEPTTGVDAVSRKEFWETLYELRRSGMTIMVSTPYMDEAFRCDRVALIQQGTIMTEDTPSSILKAYRYPLFALKSVNRTELLNFLRNTKGIRRAYLFGHSIHAVIEESLDADWLENRIKESGIGESEVYRIQPDFEDCFIEEVEKRIRN